MLFREFVKASIGESLNPCDLFSISELYNIYT